MTEYATAEMGALELAVRIDDEWCHEVKWYTSDLPVFYGPDGSEVDIRDEGGIVYEPPTGGWQEIDEPAVDKEAKQLYEPYSVYPADTIEVRDVARRPVRSESADFGGGESTGVQDL